MMKEELLRIIKGSDDVEDYQNVNVFGYDQCTDKYIEVTVYETDIKSDYISDGSYVIPFDRVFLTKEEAEMDEVEHTNYRMTYQDYLDDVSEERSHEMR